MIEFSVTDSASKRINYLIKNKLENYVAFRVSVEGGGCAGFSYKFGFAPKIEKDDKIIEIGDTKLLIDEISAQFLNGAILDFVEELGSEYFEIKNPNSTSKCGCGNSFNIS